MRMILHILAKDLRRLWPAIAGACVLLAVLANEDRWRADYIPSALEGWMTIVVSAAWACLAGFAVLQEPPAARNDYWMTRPFRWWQLLSAKLLFVVLAVHLPSLLADAWVLSARGFPPLSYTGTLLTKQFVVFACGALPALAAASLVRAFAYFVLVLFAAGAAVAILGGGLYSFMDFTPRPVQLRSTIIGAIVAAAAAAALLAQYSRRVPALVPRGIAAAGAIATAAIYAYLPPSAEYKTAAPGASITMLPKSAASPPSTGGPLRHTAFLPIAVNLPAGVPGTESRPHPTLTDVEIVTASGDRIPSQGLRPNRPLDHIDFLAQTWFPGRSDGDAGGSWLQLWFSAKMLRRLESAPVTVRGSMGFALYRLGASAPLAKGPLRDVPGVGKCSAATVDLLRDRLLKIFCESPLPMPRTRVYLHHPPSGRTWETAMNASVTFYPSPNRAWLSPLHRGQAFFSLADSEPLDAPGRQWLLPARYLPDTELTLTPEIPDGFVAVPFEFTGVRLADWLAPQYKR